MRNIFTKTPNGFNGLSGGKGEGRTNMEPSREALMFISQFAKVYYVEKRMKEFAFSTPMILN